MLHKMTFAVVGGDTRQSKLAELLKADGHDVRAFALDKQPPKDIEQYNSLALAVKDADCTVLPLPLSIDGALNTPLCDCAHAIEDVLSCLSSEQLVMGGLIGTAPAGAIQRLRIYDYYEREELAVLNAIPTAEGAIQIAMEELPFTLHESDVLIIGYGRIGKILACRLAALGARVSVSARSQSDFAWIRAYGYKPLHTSGLHGNIDKFDVIFNTVPSRILTEQLLGELKEGCLCIDIASKPGGIDLLSAAALGIKAIWALSLPGRVAAVSSARIIKETIYNIIDELEE